MCVSLYYCFWKFTFAICALDVQDLRYILNSQLEKQYLENSLVAT